MIRKLLKLPTLVEYDREELEHELNYKKYQRKYKTDLCPICSNKLYRNSWSEEYWGVVETIVRCGWNGLKDTHYLEHASYGETNLVAGPYEFGYRHNTPWIEIDAIRADWLLSIAKIIKQRKRIMSKYYRKKKTQRRRV